ncbi:MAG: hypothetical protein WCH99_05515 [Verrucomicrobiota bacterium]
MYNNTNSSAGPGLGLPPDDGVSDTTLPVAVRLSARRAWPFFDIWILSRRQC